MRRLASAAVLVLALPSPAGAGEALPFARSRLLRAASVERILVEDFTGDGKPDILVQQSPGRDLALFVQKPDGTFPFKADQRLTLREDVFAWCMGRVDASGQRRVCAMTPEGVLVHPMANGRLQPPRELLLHPTLFTGVSRRPPAYCDLLPDLGGSGRSDCVLPRKTGFLIFKQGAPGEFALDQSIPFPLGVTRSQWGSGLGRLLVAYTVPPFQVADLLGLGRNQIVFFRDDALVAFAPDAEGRFLQAPAATLPLRERRPNRRFRLIRYELPPVLADLNHDGLTDILFVVPTRGEVYVYLGKPGPAPFGKGPTPPDDLKQFEGYVANFWVRDLNGDGIQDLVLAAVDKVGVFSGLQILLTRQVDIKLMVFLGRPGRLYAPEPDYVRPFTVTLTLYVTRDSGDMDMPFFPNFDGDFNHDGLKDLVIKRSPTSLAVYPGTKEGVFAADPLYDIPLDANYDKTTVQVADLNGDGKSDLILHHIDWDTMFHDVELYISK